MAIETQVIPAVIGASKVINKTTFLADFGSLILTCVQPPSTRRQQKNSMGEKISICSIIFDYVSHELKYHIYIVFSCSRFLLMAICCWTRSHFTSRLAIMRLNIIMCRTFLSRNSTEDSRLKS